MTEQEIKAANNFFNRRCMEGANNWEILHEYAAQERARADKAEGTVAFLREGKQVAYEKWQATLAEVESLRMELAEEKAKREHWFSRFETQRNLYESLKASTIESDKSLGEMRDALRRAGDLLGHPSWLRAALSRTEKSK